MKISAKTKISVVLKADSAAIDAIVTLNPKFQKLLNPMLRKILAPRVNIQAAARMGGVTLEAFFDALRPLGFEIETDKASLVPDSDANLKEYTFKGLPVVKLDVRPNISAGNDPFHIITAAINNLPEGSVLQLINTFEPFPIIGVLKQKGYKAEVEHIANDLVHVYFAKVGEDKSAAINKQVAEEAKSDDFDDKRATFGNNIKSIDVRDLEMPLPMVNILNELEELPAGFALFVNHKKVPQYLLPELKQRNYRFLTKDVAENDVKMLIFK